MIIDIGSIMFNMEIETGGGTPSWGTDLGQSKDHKFLDKVNNIIIGMLYKSVSNIKDVFCPLGKGGSKQDDYEYVLAGKFDKIYVNNIKVEDAEFVLLIVKKITGDFHVGRRTLKYSPKITYQDSEINAECFKKIKSVLGLNNNSAWFVYDIEVINQDELHFSAIIADKDTNMIFKDVDERKNFVSKLIPFEEINKESHKKNVLKIKKIEELTYEDLIRLLKSEYEKRKDTGIRYFGIKYGTNISKNNYNLTQMIRDAGLPESYATELGKGIKLSDLVIPNDLIEIEDKEELKNLSIEEKIINQYKKSDFSEMEKEIPDLYKEFADKFSPEALFKINDNDLPRYMFYSEERNQNNMCYYIEKHPKMLNYFGRIGVYSAYVYGLHYNNNKKSWATGSSTKPIFIDYSKAIEKAKEIRKNLSDAVEIVNKYLNTQDIEDYAQILKELLDTCGNFVTNQWFVKYLHMLFPNMFTTYYSEQWQRFLISKCELQQFDNIYQRSGELALLAQRTKIATAVVSKILFNMFGYPPTEKTIDEINEKNTNSVERKIMMKRSPRNSSKKFSFNVILYGAPGTGKTYKTAEYAVNIIENNTNSQPREIIRQKYDEYVDKGQIVFTTFHQNYSYEDFIQGLRPNTENGNLVLRPEDGLFKKIADKAREDLNNDYVIIIDEINRGNISKIFGELITLIEEDKRWGEKEQLSIKLPASEELFVVPNNLYIIGTMNSADKSISLIDTALRRRFDFIEVYPNYEIIKDTTLKKFLLQLNTELKKELDSSDLLIGQSYFLDKKENDLVDILNKNIIPLLYEYHYDVENKVKNTLKEALKGIDNIEIIENKQGRIRVQNKEDI